MRTFYLFCLSQFHSFFDCTFEFRFVFLHCIENADRANLISHWNDLNLLSVMNYTRNNIIKQVLRIWTNIRNHYYVPKAVIVTGPKVEKNEGKNKLKDSKMFLWKPETTSTQHTTQQIDRFPSNLNFTCVAATAVATLCLLLFPLILTNICFGCNAYFKMVQKTKFVGESEHWFSFSLTLSFKWWKFFGVLNVHQAAKRMRNFNFNVRSTYIFGWNFWNSHTSLEAIEPNIYSQKKNETKLNESKLKYRTQNRLKSKRNKKRSRK